MTTATVASISSWVAPSTTLSVLSRHRLCRCWDGRFASTRRRLSLSSLREPPLDSAALERPCTVVLAEDACFYPTSWHDTFRSKLPQGHGVSYRKWSLPTSSSPSELTIDSALDELKRDLASVPDVVLAARGPWSSWLAQWYLESLPLRGLLMVDPLVFDRGADGARAFEREYRDVDGKADAPEYRLFREYMEHWDHWTLRLEPGSVPMLVARTRTEPAFVEGAAETARRHRLHAEDVEDSLMSLPVFVYEPSANDVNEGADIEEATTIIDEMVRWIDDRVI